MADSGAPQQAPAPLSGAAQAARKKRPPLATILTLLLAGILLYATFRGVAWEALLATVRHADLRWLAVAFLILSGSFVLRALRWHLLLSVHARFSPRVTFWATAVGYLGNNFLPARAGELIRAVLLGRIINASASYVLATALTERIVDAGALVLICLSVLTILPDTPAWLQVAARTTGVFAFCGLAGLFLLPRLEGWLLRLLARLPLPTRLLDGLIELVRQFLLGMAALAHPARGTSFIALTAAIWLVDAFKAIAVARSLQIPLTVPQALLLLAALGLASAAPSTPGAVGIFQFVAVTVLAPFGYPRNDALAYILVFQAIGYAVVIVWGVSGLWRLGRTPPLTRPPLVAQSTGD